MTAGVPAAGEAGPGSAEDGPARDLLATAELAGRLGRAESERDRLAARLARVESSAAYQVGLVLVSGARRPATAPMTVPRDVYKLFRRWRASGGRRGPPPAPTPSPRGAAGTEKRAAAKPAARLAAPPPPENLGQLLVELSRLAVGDRDRPVIAGVVSRETAQRLGPHALVNRLMPNDAVALLERTAPDLVLVDAAASLTGPWAQLGTYGAVERARELLELIRVARRRGVPVVLWHSLPAVRTPALVDAAALFDVVLDAESGPGGQSWDCGVQLGIFNPIGLAQPEIPVLFAGDPASDAGPFGTERLLELLADLVPLGLGDAGAQGRSVLVALSAPFSGSVSSPLPVRTLEHLACGARVVSGPFPALTSAFGDQVRTATDPAAALAAVTALLREDAVDPVARRATLRALFLDHATPVQLGGLLGAVGQSYDQPTRAISLLAEIADDATGDAIVDSVARQHLRPAEVLVSGPAEPAGRVVARLRDLGLAAEVGPGVASHDHRELARRARHPWVAVRRTPFPDPAHLLDLAVAAECSAADAVGYAGEDFAFVPTLNLTSALVRREVLAAATTAALSSWASSGRRLLGIIEMQGSEPARSAP